MNETVVHRFILKSSTWKAWASIIVESLLHRRNVYLWSFHRIERIHGSVDASLNKIFDYYTNQHLHLRVINNRWIFRKILVIDKHLSINPSRVSEKPRTRLSIFPKSDNWTVVLCNRSSLSIGQDDCLLISLRLIRLFFFYIYRFVLSACAFIPHLGICILLGRFLPPRFLGNKDNQSRRNFTIILTWPAHFLFQRVYQQKSASSAPSLSLLPFSPLFYA